MPSRAQLQRIPTPLEGELLPAVLDAEPVLSDDRMVAALSLALHVHLRHSGPPEYCQCSTAGAVLAEVAVRVRLAGWAQTTTSTDRCVCSHEFDAHRQYGPMSCRASTSCRCAEWRLATRTWLKTRSRVEVFAPATELEET